jgi:Tfp pilus assembly PilM family ATPase
MARSFPPDVIVLDHETLLHARFSRGKRDPRIAQAKSYRLPPDTFAPSLVTPELTNEAALADTLRRLRNETGRWEKGSILLPDSWFRINIIDLPTFNERAADAPQVVRWSLKRTLPIPPEELRVAYVVLSRSGSGAKLLVVSAMEKTLAKIERIFMDAGVEPVLIEPLGLNVWNAISVRENETTRDRLFLYVRDREFTTAVFRGEEPIFIRSRNLSGERSLQQEIRLSASYLRDALRTENFENCYIAGTSVTDVAAALSAEFSSPVKTVSLSDFVEEGPSYLSGFDAELTACTGVFTG